MKRIIFSLITLLLFALAASAQQGTVTVTVVAQPSLGTITIAPTQFYQNNAATAVLKSSTNGFSSACTATWDSTTLAVAYSSAAQSLTANITASMTATLGNHTITLSCPLPPLTLNSPMTLPNAQVGQAYSANLAQIAKVSGGVPPYSFSLTSGSLPLGLKLSSSGIVAGTTLSVGSFNFGYTVTDSSGLALVQVSMEGKAS